MELSTLHNKSDNVSVFASEMLRKEYSLPLTPVPPPSSKRPKPSPAHLPHYTHIPPHAHTRPVPNRPVVVRLCSLRYAQSSYCRPIVFTSPYCRLIRGPFWFLFKSFWDAHFGLSSDQGSFWDPFEVLFRLSSDQGSFLVPFYVLLGSSFWIVV